MVSEVIGDISEIDRVIDQRDLLAMFQPLVHLATAQVVGYEAVVTGPAGGPLAHPGRLLQAAQEVGRRAEFDWVRAALVYRAAASARMHPSMRVFLDIEPDTLLSTCPEDLLETVHKAQDRLRLVIKLRNQSLIEHPGRVLAGLSTARRDGWGVAVDASGTSRRALALLPLVYPDVIKLDLTDWVRGDLAAIARQGREARLYADTTGATVLAQGLQEPDDILLARTVGAEYGQGWHFGPPLPLPSTRLIPRSVFPLIDEPDEDVDATPFEILSAKYPATVTERRFLQPVSDYLEDAVSSCGGTALLLLSYRLRSDMTSKKMTRLVALAGLAGHAAIIGPECKLPERTPIRRSVIATNDPMGAEWNVIVLSPHYAGGLSARSLGDTGASEYRRFEYVVTHDRPAVIQAARSFVRRFG
jgi:EAL domain-containing protein (putative c-di-GMP-specific phosphodiesterase class I)